MGLGFHNDLMPVINSGHATVALDHPLVGGHLGTLIVGAVALADTALAPFAILRMGSEPLTYFCGVVLQALDARGVLLGHAGFNSAAVILTVTGEHELGSGLKLLGLTLIVGPGAALLLCGVAGEFDANQRPEGSPLGGWQTFRGRSILAGHTDRASG